MGSEMMNKKIKAWLIFSSLLVAFGLAFTLEASYFGSTTYDYELTRGQQVPSIVIHQTGYNPDVDTAASEDIWGRNGYLNWLTTASTLDASSDDANDTSAGTGARTLTVVFIDDTWTSVTETLTLAGTSDSGATTAKCIRLLFYEVATAGTYAAGNDGGNIGIITVRTTSDNTQLGRIRNDDGFGASRSELGSWSVADDRAVLLKNIRINVNSGSGATIRLWKREDADTTSAPFSPRIMVESWPSITGTYYVSPNAPFGPFVARTDMWFSCTAGANNTEVTVSFEIEEYTP